jgi:hypothetical protein
MLAGTAISVPTAKARPFTAGRSQTKLRIAITSLTDQVGQLENIVFHKAFDDDALLNRVSRLTTEVFPEQKDELASLSLPEQIQRLWQAVRASSKYSAPDAATPQTATTGSAAPQSGLTQKDLSDRIMRYVKKHMGKQVGDGECASLAVAALEESGAQPNDGYVFGRELAPGERWFLGDIVQFTQCVFREQMPKGGARIIRAGEPNHTAIFYGLKNGSALLAQQNYNNVKKVEVFPLDFRSIVSGSYRIYRPVPAAASDNATPANADQ